MDFLVNIILTPSVLSRYEITQRNKGPRKCEDNYTAEEFNTVDVAK